MSTTSASDPSSAESDVDSSGSDDTGLPPDGGPTTRYDPTHYVSPTATGNGDGSIDDPWTWAQANANATAGMRVQFAPGRYDSAGNYGGERSLAYGPVSSGTEAEPIVFFAEYPAVYNDDESLHSLLWIDEIPGTVAGAQPGTSYITWDGFSMRQGPNNDFGSEQGVWAAWGASHIRLLRCLFDQQNVGYQGQGANNWGAIFMDSSHHIEIADSIFANFPGVDENTATYLVYSVGDVEIHHNEFRNNYSDLYIKGVYEDSEYDLRPHRIHHNAFSDWHGRVMTLLGVGQGDAQPGTFCDFTQNTFSTVNGNMQITYASLDNEAPHSFRFVNNTFFGETHFGAEIEDEGFHTMYAGVPEGSTILQDTLFQNNVVAIDGAVTDLVHVASGVHTYQTVARYAHDYNLYGPGFEDDDFYGGTFAAWTAGGQDAHSLRGDPMLVDPEGGDFRLADGSPGIGAGQDVLQLAGGGAINLGAYVLADQSDSIGVRPQAVTDALP